MEQWVIAQGMHDKTKYKQKPVRISSNMLSIEIW